MRRKKLWRMLSIGLCSVMLISSFSVYADTYDSGESSEVGGIETSGGVDLEGLFKDNSAGDSVVNQSEKNTNDLQEEGNATIQEENVGSAPPQDVDKNSGLTDVVGTITTDDNGNGWLNDIPLGTYYVKETKSSPGYNLDTTTYTVEAAP